MSSYVLYTNNKGITIKFFIENKIIIDASSLFQRIPSKVNIQAISDCIAYGILFNDFQELLYVRMGKNMACISTFYYETKVSRYDYRNCQKHIFKTNERKPEILLNSSLKQINTFIGITDTSLSRTSAGNCSRTRLRRCS